jgi:hypothetical protein
MRLVSRQGGALPIIFEDIVAYAAIGTADYDPIATYKGGSMAEADLSVLGTFINNGFGVQNATATGAYIYAITWSQFDAYKKRNKGLAAASYSLTGITPRQIWIGAGDWAQTPIVKVFAGNDATYKSTVTTICVGRIL